MKAAMSKNKGVPTNAPLVSAENVAAVETSTAMPEKPRIASMSVTVPVVESVGYAAQFIQLRLSSDQARKLRDIQLGLEESNAILADGRYVNSPLDAVRWMLEKFA